MKKLLSLPNTCIAITSPEKGWLLVSDTLCDLLEYSEEELFKTTWTELTHPDDLDKDEDNFNQVLAGEIDQYHIKKRYVSKTGKIIHSRLSVDCIRRDDGSVKFFIAIISNITNLVELSQKLQTEREKYLMTLESIGDGVIATDKDGTVEFMNSVAQDLTGWVIKDAEGKKLSDVFHIVNADSRERVENPVEKVKRDGITVGLANHTILIKKDGSEIIIADSAAPIKDKEDNLVGIVLVFRDMTVEERRAAEVREKKRLSSLMDALPSIVYVVDPKTYEILYANKVLSKKYDTELVGKTCYKILQGLDAPCEFCTNDIITKQPGVPYEWEYHNPIVDRDYYIHDQMIQWPDGRMVRFESALDITEQKHVEQQKQNQIVTEKTRFSSMLDALPSNIYIVDPNTYEILYVNDALKNSFEWELVGKTCYKVLQGLDAPCEFCTNDIIKKQPGVPYQWEYHNPIVDRDYYIHDQMIQWPDGRMVRFESALDVTDQKKAEKQKEIPIQAEKSRLKAILGNLRSIIYIADTDTYEIIYANKTLTESFDTELVGKTCYRVLQGLEAPCEFCTNDLIKKQPSVPYQWEYHNPLLDMYYLIHDQLIQWPDGRMVRFESAIDITERKKLEQEREEAIFNLNERVKEMKCVDNLNELMQDFELTMDEKLESAADIIPPGFLHPDKTSARIIIHDTEFRSKNFQKSPHKLSAPIYQYLLNFGKKQKLEDTNHQTMKSVGAVEVFYQKPEEDQTNPFIPEESDLISRIAEHISKNATADLYREKLLTLNEKLQKSNKELEQFAYVASHDLQEPLRMVSSYLQLLERRYKDKLDDDADDFIKYAVDGANRMKELIQDLLKFSRVSTRAEPFVDVDPSELIEVIKRSHSILIEENEAELQYRNLPHIKADKQQLKQVFANLIQNAIKFRTDEKPIIKIDAQERDHDILFTIQDNGVGFEQQYAERIFKIFQRLHSSSKYKGTGIGLAVVKRIIERHGGRVWAESEGSNKGSKFNFTIPRNGGE